MYIDIDLSEWEFKEYFGDCLIYGKGNDRVLVEKDTQNVTFRYKMKGSE